MENASYFNFQRQANWNCLPNEIKLEIFSFLDPKSICNAALINQESASLLEEETFWRDKCLRALKTANPTDFKNNAAALLCEKATPTNYKELYLNLLAKYACMLGYWVSSAPSSNNPLSLYHLSYEENQLIETRLHITLQGELAWLPRQVILPFGQIELIEDIQNDKQENNLQLSVRLSEDNSEFQDKFGFDDSRFQTYTSRVLLGSKCRGKIRRIGSRSDPHCEAEPSAKEKTVTDLWKECLYRLKPLPPHHKDQLILAGYFKSRYSGHGYELVQVVQLFEENKIIITKVTGDPNVPALHQTVIVDLTKPLKLTLDDQLDEASLLTALSAEGYSKGGRQPFILTDFSAYDKYASDLKNCPNYCIARFRGQGTIALDGFMHAQQTEINWILFNNDTFVVQWPQLRTNLLYERVTWLNV